MTGTKQKIYMVVGVPCAGKSWVCEQLRELYTYVRHDDFMAFPPRTYVEAIKANADGGHKPVLCETPFSMSQIVDPLQAKGFDVEPVFIIEDPETLRERYQAREGKPIPAGHLTRQETYMKRAHSFFGTSAEVLEYLTQLRPRRTWPWE